MTPTTAPFPEFTPDPDDQDPDEHGTDVIGPVPPLRLVRPYDLTKPDPDPDSDQDQGDAERVTVQGVTAGESADAVDVPITATWSGMTPVDPRSRIPIIPAWLQSSTSRVQALRAVGDNSRYFLLFHLVRCPKYLAKTVWYAPVGARRFVTRLLRWATAEQGNFSLRQHAANTNDPFTWQALNRTRSKESRGRWWALGLAAAAIGIGLLVLAGTARVPRFGWYAALAGLVLAAARVGRPADQPITDRVSHAPRFTKLTADMVRVALTSLGISVMKEPGSVAFCHPGIHRDGPGWLARVNLPQGLEAVKVLEKRGALSSALRLPIDQVWPAAGPEHAGQLDLWVGYQPASTMGQPPWSLASPNARCSVFDEHEFGTDERQRPVQVALNSRSFLIGGQPGSGKSYALRALATIALLDPTAELKVAEFKGTGDFIDFEPLCSTYVCGVDDAALAAGASILAWGIGEAERRGKRLLAAKKRGEAPNGKVTPELARKPGSGLHQIVIFFDEVHELFAVHPDAAEHAERLIKRARALNMIILLATQIPDKTSLPPNIVRCVTNRWCLSVAGQVENDMILGTGAYKRGITGTVYRPVDDAGWGVMTGLRAPTAVRSHFPTPQTTAAIITRAAALRGGTVVGGPDQPTARDLLNDLMGVSAPNGQHWGPAATALTERWAHAYPTLTPEALSELARAMDVPSVTVKIGGTALKGYRLDALRDLIAARPEPSPGR